MLRSVWLLALCAAVTACNDQGEVAPEPAALGAEGESCSSRRDCSDGLACLDNRCVAPGTIAAPADGGAAVADTRGAAGESCTRRGDCQLEHACLDNVCVSEQALPAGMLPSVRGDRGESCQARNDCQSDLACINQRCLENDFDLAVQPKECFRVQCEQDEDCCTQFTAPISCPSLKVACDGGDTLSCQQFRAICECRLSCQAQLCVAVNACSADLDCGSPQLRCFGGRCAQCMSSTDCTGDDQQCVNGACRAGCERNEQCPLFHECRMGECIEAGCTTARECYFATKNPLSECLEGKCRTPCQNDAECGELHLCDQGTCTFVGCETDEECRIYLNLVSVPGSDRAVCREPDR